MAAVYFISLGCDKNRIDAEIMMASLVDAGYDITDDICEADAAVINTCGFITSAKEEAIGIILEVVSYKQSSKLKAVIVTGCLSQRYGQELASEIPEIDIVLGLSSNHDIAGYVVKALNGEKLCICGLPEELRISGKRIISTPQHYAYLKIAEGCSNHCTYCAIPGIRGGFRSRPASEIIDEALMLVSSGVREIILVAQDTTSYGRDLDNSTNLASLVERLEKIDNLWKIRILYAYPDKFDDNLIDVLSHDRVAHYIDIPFQHADENVLKRMGRHGTGEDYLELVHKLRNKIPDIIIRSTFIVGFPGETEKQFLTLCDFLKEAKIEFAGCFEYSPEEGTPAEKLKEQLDNNTKRLRAEQFRNLQAGIMAGYLESMVGKKLEIICDGFDEETAMYACRSMYNCPDVDSQVWVPLKFDLIPGEIYNSIVIETDGYDLYADIED